MNSKKEVIEAIDSSELSSDISEEEIEQPIKKVQYSPIQEKEKSVINIINSPENSKKKRTRFFSVNIEKNFLNEKSENEFKIKKINTHLKKITNDDINKSKIRKFTFA